MIRNIKVNNFKCFEDISVDLKELNLFTGVNGMGKSTLIQAILLLRQTYEKYNSLEWQNVVLNGHYINLGTINDIAYWYRQEKEIEIIVRGEETEFNCSLNDESLNLILPQEKKDGKVKLPLMGNGFEYISAERFGPKRYYDEIGNEEFQRFQIGTHGEKVVSIVNKLGSDHKVYKNMCHETEKSERLDLQINAWMTEISPGIKVNVIPYFDVNLMGLRYSVNSSMGEESTNALNMGFGVSYVLPIVVSLLKARKGDLLILENPEAHLHPKGQRRIGELISLASINGIQIIVETHSDHILNGIRLAVKQKKIQSSQVKLNYFYQFIDKKGIPRHEKTSPEILEDGSLSNWPDGFFDEWDKAIDALF